MSVFLPDLLRASAERTPERVAIRHPSGRRTYAELHRDVGRWARRLERDAAGGARIGLLLPNTADFPAALYGILRAGGTALLLNPLCAPREIAEYVADAGVRVVLASVALAPRLPPTAAVLEAERVAAEATTLSPLADAPPPTEDAVVIYTAAMGGWARGAQLTHANLVANLRSTIEAMGIVPQDRVLAMLPLIHSFGLTVTLNAALAAGASVIPVERFHPIRILKVLEASGATVIAGVPGMYAALLAAAERRSRPRHALRLAICGGSPLPAPLAEAWERLWGVPLREGYGLTEAGPVCLFNRVDQPNRLGTLGRPFPGVEVSLRDPRGAPVAGDQTGEICVAGANVFPGYLGEGGRRPEDFHGDALRTGDLGRWGPDGTVRVAPGETLTEDEVREICRVLLAAYKQPGPVEVLTP